MFIIIKFLLLCIYRVRTMQCDFHWIIQYLYLTTIPKKNKHCLFHFYPSSIPCTHIFKPIHSPTPSLQSLENIFFPNRAIKLSVILYILQKYKYFNPKKYPNDNLFSIYCADLIFITFFLFLS